MTVPIGDERYTIILRDTAGQEEYDRLRPLAYPDTDVFVVCFAVNNRESFRSVEKKWVPEVRHHKPYSKVILVCTKIDLREDDNPNHLTTLEGKQMQKKMKADRFVECSSKLMQNVNKVFAEAIAAYIFSPQKKKASSPTCVYL
ncbi:rho family gtpase [Holotrichia oblita]|uniref:Rho family gtpase n=1 Tax=Holotrichia oblita TaxID=644536 RepID=A0ACB9ST12_HOLOL|nr:rho family gtpase [Holotrichia oblita]